MKKLSICKRLIKGQIQWLIEFSALNPRKLFIDSLVPMATAFQNAKLFYGMRMTLYSSKCRLILLLFVVAITGRAYGQEPIIKYDSIGAKFFYGLDLDSARSVVIKNALNNSEYPFVRKSSPSSIPILELEGNKGGLKGSTSTSIVLEYNSPISTSQSHGEPKYPIMYGQSVSIWVEFADSLIARNAFDSLIVELLKIDHKSSLKNTFEVDEKRAGEFFKMDLGKQKDENTICTIITVSFDYRQSYGGSFIVVLSYERRTLNAEYK